MADQIHCRKRDGKLVFRVWSTVVDAYTTKELDEEEMRKHLLKRTLQRAKEEFDRETPFRFERAKSIGTSSQLGDRYDIDGPWKVWPPPGEEDDGG